jgi:hypothetical protein
VDEAGMIADDLLGAFADHLADAAIRNCRYRKRRNGSERIIGGYNLCMFGDLFQLPPIPSSGAICIPPAVKKTEQAKLALNMFWGDDADSINYFVELDEQMRLVDSETWYGRLLQECREGDLSLSNYCFLMGLPTRSTGSSLPADAPTSAPACGRSECTDRHKQWEKWCTTAPHGPTCLPRKSAVVLSARRSVHDGAAWSTPVILACTRSPR